MVAPQGDCKPARWRIWSFRRSPRECGIDAVEYVNQFFKDKARDEKYLDRTEEALRGRGG